MMRLPVDFTTIYLEPCLKRSRFDDMISVMMNINSPDGKWSLRVPHIAFSPSRLYEPDILDLLSVEIDPNAMSASQVPHPPIGSTTMSRGRSRFSQMSTVRMLPSVLDTSMRSVPGKQTFGSFLRHQEYQINAGGIKPSLRLDFIC